MTTPVAILALSACGSSQQAHATALSCAGFEEMTHGGQLQVIRGTLADNGYPADPLTIESTRITIDGYCAVNGGRAPLRRLLHHHRPLGQEAS